MKTGSFKISFRLKVNRISTSTPTLALVVLLLYPLLGKTQIQKSWVNQTLDKLPSYEQSIAHFSINEAKNQLEIEFKSPQGRIGPYLRWDAEKGHLEFENFVEPTIRSVAYSALQDTGKEVLFQYDNTKSDTSISIGTVNYQTTNHFFEPQAFRSNGGFPLNSFTYSVHGNELDLKWGTVDSSTLWTFRNGRLKTILQFRNEKLHGRSWVFDQKGKLIAACNYNNGWLNGPAFIYQASQPGQPCTLNYAMGVISPKDRKACSKAVCIKVVPFSSKEYLIPHATSETIASSSTPIPLRFFNGVYGLRSSKGQVKKLNWPFYDAKMHWHKPQSP